MCASCSGSRHSYYGHLEITRSNRGTQHLHCRQSHSTSHQCQYPILEVTSSDGMLVLIIGLRTAPRFTQPPIKLSTGSFPGVKGGQSVVPTTPPHSSAEVMESMGLYLHAPQMPSWHVTGIPLPLPYALVSKNLKVTIYKTVILPVVLYGCETWTLTLREERERLRVFENKVLRKLFGAKRDEVTGEWRKLHNTELHALYFSPDVIRNIKSRRLRWAGHVTCMGESRNAYRVLFGRPEGKRPLGKPKRMWEDNIKMDLREVGYDGRDWINLAQDRDQWRAYVRAAMNLRRRNFKTVNVIESEVETTINHFEAYSLALDESTDRNDEAHLAIFIRGVNEHFTVSECLLDVITKYNWRRSFAGTERHHRTEEVVFAMTCVRAPAS
ncbi:hypothetical protein ANN_01327 [Periplaneta americana]|uniref:Uncharacterized protein n=1 Tax=Periplaneta americana TaxID=6978 RepID=A0ABQ8TTA1_PERAM|nr:hypothetical protein ANN_01327 [Periplaneta americana]